MTGNQIPMRISAYAKLCRFDRPIGIELLLWPTLWALVLAKHEFNGTLPSYQLVVVFVLGVVFMRAAGCAINDYADKDFDAHVERTKDRPLASGLIQPKEALWVFGFFVLLSALLLLFLPQRVWVWSLGALLLASAYPFAKRYTHLPQLVLGAAFSWAIPMAYVAALGHVSLTTWLLYAANLLWTLAYDTQYAMADKKDDLKVGVKSTAILFGRHDCAVINLLHAGFLTLMGAALYLRFGWVGLSALVPAGLLILRQVPSYSTRIPERCFTTFLQNAQVGRAMFAAVLLLCVMR